MDALTARQLICTLIRQDLANLPLPAIRALGLIGGLRMTANLRQTASKRDAEIACGSLVQLCRAASRSHIPRHWVDIMSLSRRRCALRRKWCDACSLAPGRCQLADGEIARRWAFDHVLFAIDAITPGGLNHVTVSVSKRSTATARVSLVRM